MYQHVLDFWFRELTPEMWWKKDVTLDNTIKKQFLPLHRQAQSGELYDWRNTAQGALAEIILLDQFSRNIYRDTPKAFENDNMALVLAQVAIEKGFDQQLINTERSFMYLPFMHSESTKIHERAIELYTALGEPMNLNFERKHKVIIDRFGRYPHRNKILGRISTDEEIVFLTQPDSSF